MVCLQDHKHLEAVGNFSREVGCTTLDHDEIVSAILVLTFLGESYFAKSMLAF